MTMTGRSWATLVALPAAAILLLLLGCGPSGDPDDVSGAPDDVSGALDDVSGAPEDGPGACVLDATYDFAWQGGLAPESDQSVLEPPDRYRVTRSFLFEEEDVSCATTIPACGAPPGRIDVGDVREALAHPDVEAAWADGTAGQREVYGEDHTPVDGAVWVIRRGPESARPEEIVVGTPCRNAASCRAIPPGLRDLRDLLEGLRDQEIGTPVCEALQP